MSKIKKQTTFFEAVSIGIGGMIGGGIFAITGILIVSAQGATPIAFAIAGIPALLTAYAYSKLMLTYPSKGGTVTFLNRAFGKGVFTGALNIILLLSYVVLIALYAFAFGTYGAQLFPPEQLTLWTHVLITSSLIVMAAINFLPQALVISVENILNIVKLVILSLYVIVGLNSGITWSRLSPEVWNADISLFIIITSGLVVFLNYEGFELIANVGDTIKNPKKNILRACLASVTIAIFCYVAISIVAVGTLDADTLAQNVDFALGASAKSFMGNTGFVLIIIAALAATSSAINASMFGTARTSLIVAKDGELPKVFEREVRGIPIDGLLLIVVLAIIIANFLPLDAIATTGSVGFLLVFFAVNVALLKLHKETNTPIWIALLGTVICFLALVVLLIQTASNPATQSHLIIIAILVLGALSAEWFYQKVKKRNLNL